MWREEKTAAALTAQKELRERVALYHCDFEREREEARGTHVLSRSARPPAHHQPPPVLSLTHSNGAGL